MNYLHDFKCGEANPINTKYLYIEYMINYYTISKLLENQENHWIRFVQHLVNSTVPTLMGVPIPCGEHTP